MVQPTLVSHLNPAPVSPVLGSVGQDQDLTRPVSSELFLRLPQTQEALCIPSDPVEMTISHVVQIFLSNSLVLGVKLRPSIRLGNQ